jgi:hypothetical protein
MIIKNGFEFFEYKDAIDEEIKTDEHYFLFIGIDDEKCPEEDRFKYEGIVELRSDMQIYYSGWEVPETWDQSFYKNYKPYRYKYYLHGPIKAPIV